MRGAPGAEAKEASAKSRRFTNAPNAKNERMLHQTVTPRASGTRPDCDAHHAELCAGLHRLHSSLLRSKQLIAEECAAKARATPRRIG